MKDFNTLGISCTPLFIVDVGTHVVCDYFLVSGIPFTYEDKENGEHIYSLDAGNYEDDLARKVIEAIAEKYPFASYCRMLNSEQPIQRLMSDKVKLALKEFLDLEVDLWLSSKDGDYQVIETAQVISDGEFYSTSEIVDVSTTEPDTVICDKQVNWFWKGPNNYLFQFINALLNTNK